MRGADAYTARRPGIAYDFTANRARRPVQSLGKIPPKAMLRRLRRRFGCIFEELKYSSAAVEYVAALMVGARVRSGAALRPSVTSRRSPRAWPREIEHATVAAIYRAVTVLFG